MTACLCVLTAAAQRNTCIDSDWSFFYGDGSAAVANPAVADGWRTLNLPHDWSVETEAAEALGGEVIGPFAKNTVSTHQCGFTVGGEGWYRKTLELSAADLQGRVGLYFEGAYNQSWVYVNGHLCRTNVYGYSGFRFDATEQLHPGRNTVLVRVQNKGNNSRWYAGSGIYRHVWLVRTGTLHASEWDTFVRTEENRLVRLSTSVRNDASAPQGGTLEVRLLDADGHIVGATTTATGQLAASAARDIDLDLSVADAHTWSPEHPYLYNVELIVRDGQDRVTDRLTKRFGFRTLAFSATGGFLLNGQPTLLHGGCLHHDNGLLGAAAFAKAERRKLQQLKAQGYNAVRCSHNLPSESFLDLCDELGLMVVDECFDQWLMSKNDDDYHNYFQEHADEDLAVMMRRDRNHPSIIMWSIGNEIPGRIAPKGLAAAERLRAGVLKYDTTRPVTAAICNWDNPNTYPWEEESAKAFKSLDVGGMNYMFYNYEKDHEKYPDRVIFGAESFPKSASENWNLVERLPYVIGDFVWTAVDYLGEAGIGSARILPEGEKNTFMQTWPWFNGWCGDIDLIGQKKPQSYYRDVVWHRAPVTMGVEEPVPAGSHMDVSLWGWPLEHQSWTFPEVAEGSPLRVNVYSRSPRVRLYLNGSLVGEQPTDKAFRTTFTVPYTKGQLRAVAVEADGQEAGQFELATTGEPVRLRLVYEDEAIGADINDLAYVTIELVDAQGRVVTSDSKTKIKIANAGAGQLVACGTASPNDMASFRSTTPTLFEGRALAIVRSNGQAGSVRIVAEIQL